jgi:hypothetical protein
MCELLRFEVTCIVSGLLMLLFRTITLPSIPLTIQELSEPVDSDNTNDGEKTPGFELGFRNT